MDKGEDTKTWHAQDSGVRHFAVSCPEGGGGMLTLCNLFSGMQLILFDLKSNRFADLGDVPLEPGTFCISHCLKGAVACKSKKGRHYQIAEGDIAVTRAPSDRERCQLPQGVYRGIDLVVDENLLDTSTRALLKNGFGLDIDTFVEEAAGPRDVCIIHSMANAVHIFAELYSAISQQDKGYLRLKVIELMMLLRRKNQSVVVTGEVETPVQGGRRRMVAYRAQELMMQDLSHPLTIDVLAKACNASPTYLKESFKETFDVPIYTWYRRYRIQQAQTILKSDPDLSIANVASEVGYSNASKFAQAFKACTGMTPLAWRKSR